MSVRDQFKLLLGGLNARRTHRTPSATHSAVSKFLDRNRIVSAFIFVVTVVAIVLISSAGLTTATVPVMPNQVATVRVVANTSFSYESAERTRIAREQLAGRIPPVYRLETEPLRRFEAAVRDLLTQLEIFENGLSSGSRLPSNNGSGVSADRREVLNAIAESFNSRGPYRVSVEDIIAVLNVGDARMRATLFENGLAALRD